MYTVTSDDQMEDKVISQGYRLTDDMMRQMRGDYLKNCDKIFTSTLRIHFHLGSFFKNNIFKWDLRD